MMNHYSVPIIASANLDESEAFYKRLGFHVLSDYGHYRILADGRGWHLHLNHVPNWPPNVEDNPFGIYLYVDDVDEIAAKVSDLIIEQGTPCVKPWGVYEFAFSDPSGLLVRIGRIVSQDES
ncbi:VOC family protein [Paenibacillus sp. WLX2291]|uniref:VOC family protein n=1 Tax=Paenibacillus sp. WLX2291 TaxID=3296934 RepID=UPI00398416FF